MLGSRLHGQQHTVCLWSDTFIPRVIAPAPLPNLTHKRGEKTGEEVSCGTDKQHRKASSADEVGWPSGTGQDFVSDGSDFGSVHQ